MLGLKRIDEIQNSSGHLTKQNRTGRHGTITMRLMNTNKQMFLYVSVFLLAFSLFVLAIQPALGQKNGRKSATKKVGKKPENKLSYDAIKRALQTKIPNGSFRTKAELLSYLVGDVRKLKVDQPLTPEIKAELVKLGANDALLLSIQKYSPPLPPPPTAVVERRTDLGDLRPYALEVISPRPTTDPLEKGNAVLLSLEIDEAGTVTTVTTLSGLSAPLTEKAVEVAKGMKFRAASHQGKPSKARGSLAISFVNIGAILARADELRAAGSCAPAIVEYGRVLEAEPNNPKALYGGGYCNLVEGNFERAVTDLNLYTNSNSTDAEAFFDLGIANDYLGDESAATVSYTRALELKPEMRQRPIWSCLFIERASAANIKFNDGKLTPSGVSKKLGSAMVEACGTVPPSAAGPFMSLVQFRRGIGYFYREDFAEAITNLEMAKDALSPRFRATRPYLFNAYFGRGINHSRKNKWRLAADDLSKAIEYNPQLAEPYVYRCTAYIRMDRVDDAISDCSSAIKLSSSSVAALH